MYYYLRVHFQGQSVKAFYRIINDSCCLLYPELLSSFFDFWLTLGAVTCIRRLNTDLLLRRPVRHWLHFPFSISCSPISVIPQTLRTRVSFIDLHIALIPLKVVNQAPSGVADYFTSIFIHCLQQLSEIVL